MNFRDLHIHTVFSDGEDEPEEIVKKAIERKMNTIGFSDHSYTAFDERYCMRKAAEKEYKVEIWRLKEKYKSEIKILCGIEQDFYSEPAVGYDYIIGSVHYIRIENEYVPVDESADILRRCAKKHFSSDMYKLAEKYYQTVANVAKKTRADIIGHFDLIAKFNEIEKLFDENDERYVKSYKSAADELLKSNAVFEINTGAISRGYRTTPYPNKNIIEYIKQGGGKFILSSDSHDKDSLLYEFDKWSFLL